MYILYCNHFLKFNYNIFSGALKIKKCCDYILINTTIKQKILSVSVSYMF